MESKFCRRQMTERSGMKTDRPMCVCNNSPQALSQSGNKHKKFPRGVVVRRPVQTTRFLNTPGILHCANVTTSGCARCKHTELGGHGRCVALGCECLGRLVRGACFTPDASNVAIHQNGFYCFNLCCESPNTCSEMHASDVSDVNQVVS